MNNLEKLKEIEMQVRTRLTGHISQSQNGIVIDAFLSPNNWDTAKIVYDFRKSHKSFPFNKDQNLSMVAELLDGRLIEAKKIIVGDLRNDLIELIANFADMEAD